MGMYLVRRNSRQLEPEKLHHILCGIDDSSIYGLISALILCARALMKDNLMITLGLRRIKLCKVTCIPGVVIPVFTNFTSCDPFSRAARISR